MDKYIKVYDAVSVSGSCGNQNDIINKCADLGLSEKETGLVQSAIALFGFDSDVFTILVNPQEIPEEAIDLELGQEVPYFLLLEDSTKTADSKAIYLVVGCDYHADEVEEVLCSSVEEAKKATEELDAVPTIAQVEVYAWEDGGRGSRVYLDR